MLEIATDLGISKQKLRKPISIHHANAMRHLPLKVCDKFQFNAQTAVAHGYWRSAYRIGGVTGTGIA